MSRIASTALAVTGLLGGYATGRATKKRPLAAVVLGTAGTGAFLLWKKDAGTTKAIALISAYLGGFGASHPLAKKIGAWPAVNSVTAGVAILSLLLGGSDKNQEELS
ncbi:MULTISPECIES: hypothetical protein [Glutamicibacter]|uniref:Conserved hypothetical membrane protein n=1 Tax=Glutamicibacter arilaitensis (strain DSM 16368 / CIP 108037 / IAM 15318 / JCM 13566 / NCIMB 14258 / Re117) TaxID=861360 RepID=A0ABM9PUG3_GLUAR|nr:MULTISPECIES: hypothetical protein [Glutamicibacter]CBT74836.1 conserved hypothetical membrane protein [Glutamicibacter arilaitensis Re117]HCH48976.1 hypothetical protein [Glutamicibacter sp.]HCJ53970.1 hypothetical protein [Glutamicibacter sp.]HCM95702.1 hypothetical protein [Glutamicibacter sp.]